MASSSMNSSSISNSQGEGSRRGSQPRFSKDEQDLIARMYKLVGNRWSIIAGRIPGRSAEEIKRYCNSPFFKTSLEEADSAFTGDSEDYAKK